MLWFNDEQIVKAILVADGVFLWFLMVDLAQGPMHLPVSKGVLPCVTHHGCRNTEAASDLTGKPLVNVAS